MRSWRNDLPAASSTADTLAITPLLLLLFVLPPTPALGQTCEQPIQSILPKPCQNIVTYPLVYVSPGQSQRLVSVLTSKLLKPFIASPTTCQAAASSFICAFSYSQCRWSNSSSPPSPPTPLLVLSSNSSSSKSAAAFYQARKDAATAVNIPPCRSSCQAFLQACALLFEDLLPYDCNQLPPDPASLLPLLSHSSSSPLPSPSAILSSTRQTQQEERKTSQQQQTCFLPAAYNGTYPIYLCPDDLGLVAEDGRCVSSCKSPIWTTSEWNTFHIILNVGGWVSAFGVLFVIITFLLDPWKTGRKSRFVIYLCIAELICAVNFVWASLYGHFNILCDGQHRNFDGPLCIAWSSVFVWSSWTATAWWFNVVLNVQLVGWRRRLGLQRKSFLLWNKVILVGHHVWGWGAGLLVVIIGVVVGKNGAAPGYPICLYQVVFSSFFSFLLSLLTLIASSLCNEQQDDTSDPTSMSFWALSLYYIPINIAVLIGFLLMVGLAWRIYKTVPVLFVFFFKKNNTQRRETKKQKKRKQPTRERERYILTPYKKNINDSFHQLGFLNNGDC
ncbi:Frizzled-9, variant 2 [Balamuthia mandrillaris]